MNNNKDVIDSKTIKIIICPNNNGFSCSIDRSTSKNMTFDEYDLANTIARGLVYKATEDPHSVFLSGLDGFNQDKVISKKETLNKRDKGKNVIDFLEYLKRKTDCKKI